MKNKWKLAFFALLSVVIILFCIILIMINRPIRDSIRPPNTGTEQIETNQVELGVTTNKNDLNQMIDHYLKKEGLTGPIDYQVILSDEVELYGTFPVFDQNLEMLMTFEPRALNNGDLVLKQKAITIGTLNLPVGYVMKFIQKNYRLPECVQIHPESETVYVALQEMKLKNSNIKVRVNSFNLKDDKISFTLVVPVY